MKKPFETSRAEVPLAGSETGMIRKSWHGRVRVALIYPNGYRVGMSNLGFQAVYRLFNDQDDIVCERAFLPEYTAGERLRITTLESRQPLHEFDIIAFSFSFENDYPNILTILHLAGIPPASIDRGDPLPLVIAGGVACMLNPEPIADFVDCFFIGEAEVLIPSFIRAYRPELGRRARLKQLAQAAAGCYVPRFYQPSYTSDGLVSGFAPVEDVPASIRRLFVTDIGHSSTQTAIHTAETVFNSSFLVEVSRGCPHSCRFCAASYVYRPYRYRSRVQLEQSLMQGLALTDTIGLVGAAVSDLPQLDGLCKTAFRYRMRLAFSSLRADRLSPGVLSALQQSGVKTATVAPDAGSQRMRNAIRKNIRESHILNAVSAFIDHDIPNIKLYFMVGLPTETGEDIDAIVALCRSVKRRFLSASRSKARIGEIVVGINPFVPKPATPFQWAGMDDERRLKRKVRQIRKQLSSVANLKLQTASPRQAYLQSLFSRGDRRTSEIIMAGFHTGWNWAKALGPYREEADAHVYRQRSFDECLPWDFIDNGVPKIHLWHEWERALSEANSEG